MRDWKRSLVVIVSKRLLLMPLALNDAEDVLGWINNPEIAKNFQFFNGNTSIGDEVRYIEKMRNSPNDLLLGVILEGEELIGTCGLHEIDFHNYTARLGVIIGKREHCNKGYAEEAIRALIVWAFSVMHLNKIYLSVFATNEKGIHLYTKVGFQVEAPRLRQEYRIRGAYVDMVRMAILREEWEYVAQVARTGIFPPE